MKEIKESEVNKLVEKWSTNGKKWHFHMLTPTCKLSTRNECAFVIENTTDKEIYVIYSTAPLSKLGKELVQKVHGEKIIAKSVKTNEKSKIAPFVIKAIEYSKNKLYWHHHMLFPDCIFNTSKGKWVILFEDPKTREKHEITYENEPIDDLSKLEKLYYEQTNSH